jgi:hypothetical protein
MKKFIALILAVMVVMAAAATVSAHSDNKNAGSIPKTAVAPSIDGVKDDIYDQGLFIPVRNGHSATPDGGLGGGADAWMLWDDDNWYVFMKIDLAGFYSPDDWQDLQTDQPWALTTCEVLIDFANNSDEAQQVCQVRMNDKGFPNVTLMRDDPHLNGDECKQYIEWGFSKGDNYYCAEFKLKMSEFRKGVESVGVIYGSDWAAGKAIGLYLFSQECADDGTQALFVSVPTEMSGNWAPANYDYVTLGGDVVGAPPPAEPEPEAPAEQAPAPEPAAPAPVAPAPAPTTGDSALWLVVLTMAAAGAFVAAKRRAVK